jgi:O-antigen/teichoic acid export membrane protein
LIFKKGENMKNYVLLVTLLTIVTPAMAYIDPGSGSAIMSAIIGFFVAIGLAIKTYWYKIKSIFKRKK